MYNWRLNDQCRGVCSINVPSQNVPSQNVPSQMYQIRRAKSNVPSQTYKVKFTKYRVYEIKTKETRVNKTKQG